MLNRTKSKENDRAAWMLLLASLLIPLFVTLFFFSMNIGQVLLGQVLLICGVEAVIAAVLFIGALAVFRDALSAFAVSVVFWPIFFGFGGIREWFYDIFQTEAYGTVFVAGLCTVACVAAGLAVRKRKAPRTTVAVVALTLFAVLTVFDVVRIGAATWARQRESAAIGTSGGRQTYVVDQNEDLPNIYWIHCDGMLSFDAVEKYFGDDQSAFAQALVERGFALNRSAYFDSLYFTFISIPALMSPQYYDRTLENVIATSKATRGDIGNSEGVTAERKNPELFAALRQKGYRIKIASTFPDIFFPESADLFLYSDYINRTTDAILLQACNVPSMADNVNLEEMRARMDRMQGELFLETFALPIYIAYQKLTGDMEPADRACEVSYTLSDAEMAQLHLTPSSLHCDLNSAKAFYMMLNTPLSPELTVILFDMTHYPFAYDREGRVIDTTNSSRIVANYYGNHLYASTVLVGMIDAIQARDQDAVIVLQSDHGLHQNTAEDFKEALGETASEQELWNSVMSAVCVPRRYRDDDVDEATVTPLNITRWLVNRFVGAGNYAYRSAPAEP